MDLWSTLQDNGYWALSAGSVLGPQSPGSAFTGMPEKTFNVDNLTFDTLIYFDIESIIIFITLTKYFKIS